MLFFALLPRFNMISFSKYFTTLKIALCRDEVLVSIFYSVLYFVLFQAVLLLIYHSVRFLAAPDLFLNVRKTFIEFNSGITINVRKFPSRLREGLTHTPLEKPFRYEAGTSSSQHFTCYSFVTHPNDD